MPIAVIKYRCQFKCGRSAKESKKSVEEHESKCWKNPANCTCKTCKYEDYSTENDDYGLGMGFKEWKERHCNHPEGDKISEDEYKALTINDMHIKPVVNCLHWVKK